MHLLLPWLDRKPAPGVALGALEGAIEALDGAGVGPADDQQALLDALLSHCDLVEVYYAWRPNLQDEGDNHVFELAVAAQDATLLTWNLRDFASAELRFPQVRVVTPAQWMKEKA